MKKLIVLSVAIGCFTASAAAQEALTPRDSFWSASDLVDVAANPAAPPPQAKTATDANTRRKSQPATTQKAIQVAAKGYGAEPHIVKFTRVSQQPLGIRYALLKVGEGGALTEALPKTTFHSGDKVKISLMANQPGYIYIIQRGSSGNWQPLFPLMDDPPESNRVEAGRIYQVPAGKSFQFNQQTGQERLFILLTRQVVSDLDGIISKLRLQQRDATPLPDGGHDQVDAENRISDELVEKLQSRDLTTVIDPPQETSEKSLGENAIYVVSQGRGGASASQVFANLVLDHQ